MPVKTDWLTNERKEILEAVVRDYTTATGGRDWNRAMAEHPAWAAALDWDDSDSKHKAHSTASRIAIRRGSAPAKSGRPSAVLVGDDQRQLILQIIRNYTVDGAVRWSNAFGEHPEWKAQLGIKGDHGDPMMKRLYPMGAYILKRDPQFADLRKAKPPRAVAAVVESNGGERVTAEPVAPEPPINYCPSCGFNFRMLRAAFTVALKHSLKGQR